MNKLQAWVELSLYWRVRKVKELQDVYKVHRGLYAWHFEGCLCCDEKV